MHEIIAVAFDSCAGHGLVVAALDHRVAAESPGGAREAEGSASQVSVTLARQAS
jgi:hypothetical protein